MFCYSALAEVVPTTPWPDSATYKEPVKYTATLHPAPPPVQSSFTSPVRPINQSIAPVMPPSTSAPAKKSSTGLWVAGGALVATVALLALR